MSRTDVLSIGRLVPMAEMAKLIQRHLPNMLTCFRHRVTNVGVKSVNLTIQWIKKAAHGFHNIDHFKTAIYSNCRGLDLYPTHKSKV